MCLKTRGKEKKYWGGFHREVDKQIEVLTIWSHSHGQTFLKSTILTSVSMVFGHLAVPVAPALIAQLFPDGPLEEAFAAFTADGSVMTTYNKTRMNKLVFAS